MVSLRMRPAMQVMGFREVPHQFAKKYFKDFFQHGAGTLSILKTAFILHDIHALFS